MAPSSTARCAPSRHCSRTPEDGSIRGRGVEGRGAHAAHSRIRAGARQRRPDAGLGRGRPYRRPSARCRPALLFADRDGVTARGRRTSDRLSHRRAAGKQEPRRLHFHARSQDRRSPDDLAAGKQFSARRRHERSRAGRGRHRRDAAARDGLRIERGEAAVLVLLRRPQPQRARLSRRDRAAGQRQRDDPRRRRSRPLLRSRRPDERGSRPTCRFTSADRCR